MMIIIFYVYQVFLQLQGVRDILLKMALMTNKLICEQNLQNDDCECLYQHKKHY